MKNLLETIGVFIIIAIVVSALLGMIAPYVPLAFGVLVLAVIVGGGFRYLKRW